MSNIQPKVFISYSWENEQHKEKVEELGVRLRSDGVDVILDIWDLKEGQDKYAFMEQCVNDETINIVLIICDKSYAEKANSRVGGVGNETEIITPQVYGKIKQIKYIPIIFEFDENNNPYMPIYLKGRMYINLSTDDELYESEYEKLLRLLYEKPLKKKPLLGKMPEWLNDDIVSYTKLNSIIKQIKYLKDNQENKFKVLVQNYIDECSIILDEFRFRDGEINEESLLKKIGDLKIIRDNYLFFLENIINQQQFTSGIIVDFFTEIYNSSHTNIKDSYTSYDYEHFDFFIWESFISTIAMLLHYRKYKEIYSIIHSPYFLKRNSLYTDVDTFDFTKFRCYLYFLEKVCKKFYKINSYSYSAELLINREKKPIITKKNLIEADLLLYRLGSIDKYEWFPYLYFYGQSDNSMWIKLKSKSYCEEIFPLFGVNSIEELKQCIAKAKSNNKIKYRESWDYATNILDYIKIEEIATLN